mmetsp:Transcript_20472/g.46475  ORF Transcript_20472/g.46475 Transcript_20472/m.46475 type:complete len:118 (-) Transcript_20472:187-540(-)
MAFHSIWRFLQDLWKGLCITDINIISFSILISPIDGPISENAARDSTGSFTSPSTGSSIGPLTVPYTGHLTGSVVHTATGPMTGSESDPITGSATDAVPRELQEHVDCWMYCSAQSC